MATTYPAQIDNVNSLPIVVDGQTPLSAAIINGLRGAIINIEQTLGVNPAAGFGTIGGALITLQNTLNNLPPAITLGGDLGGTLTNQQVIGIQGRPVTDTLPTSGQVLSWSGIAWVPTDISGGGGLITFSRDLSGNSNAQTVTGIQGVPVSTNSVANDGFALVSTGGVYIPTGIAPVFNVKNFGAKGNGIADDTIPIQAAITAANSSGGGIVYLPAIHLISSTLNIISGANITLSGIKGLTKIVANTTSISNAISISNSNYVAIDSIVVQAANTDTGSTGILIAMSTNCSVHDCHITGFGTNGIKTIAGGNIDIHNNIIDGTNANVTLNTNGIYILQSGSTPLTNIGYRINNNDISNTGQGIASGTVSGLIIANNFIHDITAAGAQHGMYLASSDMTITGNIVQRVNSSGIKILSAVAADITNITVVGNSVDGGWNGINTLGDDCGLDINGTATLDGYMRNLTVSANSIRNFSGFGIYLGYPMFGISVTNNTLYNIGLTGIEANPLGNISYDNRIANNILENVALNSGHGIAIVGAGGILNNIIIDDNVIDGVPKRISPNNWCIYADSANGLYIRRNRTIGASNAPSLVVQSSCSNVLIIDNVADDLIGPTLPFAIGSTSPLERNSWNPQIQTITGTYTQNAGLHSLLGGLNNFGLITDATTSDANDGLVLAAGSQTINVTGIRFLSITGNASGSTITDFTGPAAGQELQLQFNDSHVTITRDNTNFVTTSNFTSSQFATLRLVNHAGVWDEASRSTPPLLGDVIGNIVTNTVTKIQGVPVSTNSVSNDGYALVSTGNTYVPTGVAPVFNVKNFGAIGNNSHDDTNSIQSAIAAAIAAGGGTVHFPLGNYLISSPLSLSANVAIILQGAGFNFPQDAGVPFGNSGWSTAVTGTIIHQTAAFDAIQCFSTVSLDAHYPTIRDIAIVGPGLGGSYSGFNTVSSNSGIWGVDCANLLVANFPTGLNLCTFSSKFSHVTVSGCDGYGISIGNDATSTSFYDLIITYCPNPVYLTSGESLSFFGGVIEGTSGGNGFWIQPANGTSLSHVYIEGFYIENTTGSAILFDTSYYAPGPTGVLEFVSLINVRSGGYPVLFTTNSFILYGSVNQLSFINCDFNSAITIPTWAVATASINSRWTSFIDNGNNTQRVLDNLGSHYYTDVNSSVINVNNYGAVGDGATDDTAAIQAACNAAIQSNCVYFPFTGHNYIIKQPIVISSDNRLEGLCIKGQGPGSDTNGTAQTTIAWGGTGPVIGTAGTFSSVTNDQFSLATIVTFTGVTSTTGVSAGDTITISNAANTVNNGSFTIINIGSNQVSYCGFNMIRGLSSSLPNITDANNGSIHYSISRPMFKVYSRGNRFENLTLSGGSGVSALVDCTFPTLGGICTHNEFLNVNFTNGIFGVKIGDYGPNSTQPTNCDLHRFESCYFNNQTDTAIYIPNATGQSKLHEMHHTAISGSMYGIRTWSGSFRGYTGYFQCSDTAILLGQATDMSSFRDYDMENTPRLLVTYEGVNPIGTQIALPFIVAFDGLRVANNSSTILPADGYFVQMAAASGLSIRNATILEGYTGYTNLTFAVASTSQRRAVNIILDNVVLPNNNSTVISAIGPYPVTYYTMQVLSYDGAGGYHEIPNGLHTVQGLGGGTLNAPPFGIVNLTTQSIQQTLANSVNIDLANLYHTSIEWIGGGASCTIAGIIAGDIDQIIQVSNLTGSAITLKHEDSADEPTAANRIYSISGADVTFNLSATLRYSPAFFRWLIIQYQ